MFILHEETDSFHNIISHSSPNFKVDRYRSYEIRNLVQHCSRKQADEISARDEMSRVTAYIYNYHALCPTWERC